jgi:hypothetical protein
MRIAKVDGGHALREKLLLGVMRLATGRTPPDVVKSLLYRRDFWGDPYNEVFQIALRGPSEWSVGERELFAAFVSKQVHCSF